MKDNTEQFRAIAKACYEWAKSLQLATPLWDKHLTGLCAITSVKMSNVLRHHGIKNKIALSLHESGYMSHFCVIAEGFILDATVDQFKPYRGNNFVVCPAMMSEHWFHQPYRFFKSGNAVYNFQLKNRWPKEQLCEDFHLNYETGKMIPVDYSGNSLDILSEMS